MSYWQVVGSQSVQAITDRLYLGWEAFFAGDIKRPPTFRKRRKYRSFTLKQSGYKVLGHGRITILSRNYRFNQSRPLTGIIKTVTVRRDPIRDFYITFSCDQVAQPEQAPKTGLTAGADFGLKDFVTLSTGERIAAPQPLKAQLRRLRKTQRRLSRKQKGSKVPQPRKTGSRARSQKSCQCPQRLAMEAGPHVAFNIRPAGVRDAQH